MNSIGNELVCYDDYFEKQHEKIIELINHIKYLKNIIYDLKYENTSLLNENNKLSNFKYTKSSQFKQYYYQSKNFNYEDEYGKVKGCFFY
jgi:phage regulator Rha-like protein